MTKQPLYHGYAAQCNFPQNMECIKCEAADEITQLRTRLAEAEESNRTLTLMLADICLQASALLEKIAKIGLKDNGGR